MIEAALLAGVAETASEMAVESAAIASELEGIKDTALFVEKATELFDNLKGVVDSIGERPGRNFMSRTLRTGARGEFAVETLDMLEAAEVAEDAEALEGLSEYDNAEKITREVQTPRVGQSAFPLARGSYVAQLSRLQERYAAKLYKISQLCKAEAAMTENAALAEELQELSEIFEEVSDIADKMGDYVGAVSYPEIMIRHSPTNN